MGCVVSFFMFKISGWCIQRHLYVKGRCWLCQIEVLLLDLLFMCDWESLWWGCSSWWPPFQSPDDPYFYTAVCSQRQWAGRQILYVMLDSSDLWLGLLIFAYSGVHCWRLFYMLVSTQFSEWSYLHLYCSCLFPFALSFFFRVSCKAAQLPQERLLVWSVQAYMSDFLLVWILLALCARFIELSVTHSCFAGFSVFKVWYKMNSEEFRSELLNFLSSLLLLFWCKDIRRALECHACFNVCGCQQANGICRDISFSVSLQWCSVHIQRLSCVPP